MSRRTQLPGRRQRNGGLAGQPSGGRVFQTRAPCHQEPRVACSERGSTRYPARPVGSDSNGLWKSRAALAPVGRRTVSRRRCRGVTAGGAFAFRLCCVDHSSVRSSP